MINFSIDQELSSAPTVSVLWGGEQAGSREASLVTTSKDGLSWSFSYIVGDTEPEGFASISIDLISVHGITAQFLQPRTLEFDFTTPRIVPDTDFLQFAPAENSLLSSVSKAGVGSIINIGFAVNELLSENPVVKTITPDVLPFVCDPPMGTFFQCSYQLDADDASLPQGIYTIVSELVDLAGNTEIISLPSFEVDTIAPDAPAVETENNIIYHRHPTGSHDTDGLKTQTLEGASGAAEPDTTIIIWDGEHIETANELGRQDCNSDGSIDSFKLAGVDRQRVYATIVDKAGNVSDAHEQTTGIQATLITDVALTASLNGKIAYDTIENVHHISERTMHGPALIQKDSHELSDNGILGSIDNIALRTKGAGDWVQYKSPILPPGEVTSLKAAFDSWRSRVIVVKEESEHLELWEWDGHVWSIPVSFDAEGDGEPNLERYGLRVAFDSKRGKFIMFGGEINHASTNEMWIWTGFSWKKKIVDNPPPARNEHSMAFDEKRNILVVFGGMYYHDGINYYLGDTWEWDGTSWHEVHTPGPAARSNASMVYDSERQEIVLYGGLNRQGDGETDCGSNLVGTAVSTYVKCNYTDTWVYNGLSWKMKCDSSMDSHECGDNPPGSYSFGAAYDDSRGRFILFSGANDTLCNEGSAPGEGHCPNDTYEWDGHSWEKIIYTDPYGDGTPNRRISPTAVYDKHRNTFYMFSGENEFDPCTPSGGCNIMWQWDGSDWIKVIDPNLPLPYESSFLPSYYDQLIYHEARDRIVVNGRDTEGYTYQFDGMSWFTYPMTNITPRNSAQFVYDPLNETGVLYGGSNFALPFTERQLEDTWYWTGTSWLEIPSSTNPGKRILHCMAYDIENQTTVVFGGYYDKNGGECGDGDIERHYDCYHDDTYGLADWGIDDCGNTDPCWKQLAAGEPGFMRYCAMAYDEKRKVIVMYGGEYLNPETSMLETHSDTYEWDGSSWKWITDAGPPGRTAHHLVYDKARQRVLLVGGLIDSNFGSCESGESWCNDIWEWDGQNWTNISIADPSGDGDAPGFAGRGVTYVEKENLTLVMERDDSTREPMFWAWNNGYSDSASHTVKFILNQYFSLNEIIIKQLDIRWAGGADGYAPQIKRTGVSLSGWLNGSWQTLKAENPLQGDLSYGAENPGTVDWCGYAFPYTSVGEHCIQFNEIEDFINGRDNSVYLLLEPVWKNGSETGSIASDYVEMTLHYRISDESKNEAKRAKRDGGFKP
jgi:hypothetical protein